MIRTAISGCVFATAVAAQGLVTPAAIPTSHFQGVFVSDFEDGACWVRGERYKLGLGEDGGTYVPLFGPKAARDFPVRLALRAARVGNAPLPLTGGGEWQRDGERFGRDRGAVRECWQVGKDGAQQYFEIASVPGEGALALAIDVATDMTLVDDGPGVRFLASGLGEVRCSDAVAIDARGRRLELPVQVADGRLTIVVPAAFVAEAAWPLVIDPLLTTWALDNTVSDIQDPRVACEPTTGNWLVVAEEHLSASSVDIVCWRYDSSATPTLLDTVYAENGTDRTNNPGVGFAGQSQQFLVCWHNVTGGNFRWRARSAGATTMGSALTLSAGIGGDLDNRPMIGSSMTSDRFLTILFRKNSTGTDILATLCRSTGTNLGSMFVGPLTLPSSGTAVPGGVSVAQTLADKWVVIWRECPTVACASQQIRMQAIVSSNGVGPLTGEPTVTLASSSNFLTEPDIAGRAGNLLAVWRAFDGATLSNDIHGVPVAITGGLYAAQGQVQNLSAQEPGVANVREQFGPSVTYDGCRFVYGYLEDNGNDLVFPHAATVFVSGSSIAWHEGHLALSTVPGLTCRSLDLGYGADGNLGVHWAVFQQDSATFTGDVYGAQIDARQSGVLSVLTQTGCGLPSEPPIALTGTPALGRTFSITVTPPVGFTFLLAGQAQVQALPGCGSCMTGVNQATMFVFSQSSLGVSVPCDSTMMGLRLAFQGLVAFQPGGCPASVFGLEFALSDTISIQVR